jgi:hypothetical protein
MMLRMSRTPITARGTGPSGLLTRVHGIERTSGAVTGDGGSTTTGNAGGGGTGKGADRLDG